MDLLIKWKGNKNAKLEIKRKKPFKILSIDGEGMKEVIPSYYKSRRIKSKMELMSQDGSNYFL
ncbi:hypothetical protein BKP37_15310 [Anaerobacillus alkalilacustris]|uniref:Uncharacterized protein n=1 Tax=Anaerobacillus alkalilacustris TaxID=393763 RepID=A0A1S2LHL6_9BACI|nr:hypothetical protein BKP37_15310 [Anaerobacillus alkalilacustris]